MNLKTILTAAKDAPTPGRDRADHVAGTHPRPTMTKGAAHSTKPLPLHEKEYRQSLYRLERRAIIPLKWSILFVTLIVWVWIVGSRPTPPVFLLFLSYFLFNSTQTYFFFFSKVTIGQIKPLTLFSYLTDVIFVSMLIYFDLAKFYFGPQEHHDFYVLYFLLVMRGFALFKTIAETIFVNFLVSVLYILTFYLQQPDLKRLLDSNFSVSLILIWLVILMSWFIVSIITKQKSELLEVQDRLLRADNLARVGELAAGVAHEINNPIGIIAATAEYLKMRSDPNDDRLEDIEAIHTEAMRCRDIVQEMLTYAHPRPIGTASIEPRSLNDEVLYFVFPRNRGARYEVVREYEDDPPLILADPNLVKQALMNIYINAKQAIPEGRPGRIVSRILSQGRGASVCIEVEDNGDGIDPEDIDYIFEPFFTRKAQGTGLGLAVTQQIVEKLGGSIAVRPAETGGSVFTLILPAAKE